VTVKRVNDKAVAFQNEDFGQDSFESFFLRNYKRVFGFLYRITGERMEAEDLTVETFLRYLNKPPERKEHAEAWLFRVATRLGYNALRSAKRRNHYEGRAGLYIAGTPIDPSQELERDRERNRVRSVLRKLDRRGTAILLLHHSGCSYKEIATAVNVAPASVGTLLVRAQKQFARLYGAK
jgi:RNA polymerase sigma-70 factor (ECF subfamily)